MSEETKEQPTNWREAIALVKAGKRIRVYDKEYTSVVEVWADINMFGEVRYYFQPMSDHHRNGQLSWNGSAQSVMRSEGMLARKIRDYGYVRTRFATYEVVE